MGSQNISLIQAVAVAKGSTAPTNTEVLWIDESISSDFLYDKLKGYDNGVWRLIARNAEELLKALKTVDGAGSGLDADTLQGYTPADLISSGGSVPPLSTGKLLVGQADTIGVAKTITGIATIDTDGVLTYTNNSISHTGLTDIGTNTHAQIDTHIANTSNPHNVTAAQVGNTTAQWNANQINGNTTNVGTPGAGEDGYAIVWDNTAGEFILGTVSGSNIANANLTWTAPTSQDLAGYSLDFLNGNLGIGATPDASALLDLSSTSKGIRIPQMTTAQRTAIASPATGLVVEDTDLDAWYTYNGSSWVKWVAGYGLISVNNSNGEPTFYASLSAAITAASAGNTIQIYSDITETGAVTVTCKNGVNINFNGFTYTLNNASTSNAFSVPDGVSMEMFNGKVVRIGGTSSTSNSLAIYTTGAGTFKANNMVFESDFGTAGNVGSSMRSFYGGVFYGSGVGFFLDTGKLYNAICNGGTGAGLQIQNNGKAYICEGYSSSSYGIYNNASNAYFCIGRSDGNYGFWGAAGNSHDCKGYSTANVGLYISSNGSFSNIYGFSSSSMGVFVLGNGVGITGYSTASNGVYFSSGTGSSYVIQDVKAISTAAAGMYILLNAGKVEFSNLDVASRWNHASGHGIIVTGSDDDIILNRGSIRVENASANCLYNSYAKNCYFVNLGFLNSTTAVNANITNLQTNTPDAYGNILVG